MPLQAKRSSRRALLDRYRLSNGHIAEFPLALFVLFFLILFPFVNLLGLATAAATTCLLAHTAVSRAAAQERFDLSLTAMTDEADNFMGSGFAVFSGLKPAGGYAGCGCDLYVTATNYRGQTMVTYDANKAVPPPIDTSQWIYEYGCRCTFDANPLVNLSFVPFMRNVPGLGKPARLTSIAHRMVEYPNGLAGSNNAKPSAASKSFQSKVPSPGEFPGQVQVAESGWDFPNLYAQIAQAGQEVVESTVLKVYASNENWTDTTLTTSPGQRLWFDFQSDGKWNVGTGADGISNQFIPKKTVDGNGYTGYYLSNDDSAKNIQWASLAGQAGTEKFFVGRDRRNFEPASSGRLMLRMTDEQGKYADNEGFLTVRIVVTQAKN